MNSIVLLLIFQAVYFRNTVSEYKAVFAIIVNFLFWQNAIRVFFWKIFCGSMISSEFRLVKNFLLMITICLHWILKIDNVLIWTILFRVKKVRTELSRNKNKTKRSKQKQFYIRFFFAWKVLSLFRFTAFVCVSIFF